MVHYLIRRLLLIVPTLIGMTMVVFLVMAMAPGDPASAMLDAADLDPEVAREVEAYYTERYQLDAPVHVQYATWLNRVSPIGFQTAEKADELTGWGLRWQAEVDDESKVRSFGLKPWDLGESHIRGREVTSLLAETLPITILLSLLSTPLVYVIAIGSGIWAARHRGGAFDRVSGTLYLALWSVPTIWAGVLLIGFLANEDYLRWFPAAGISSSQADRMAYLPTGDGLAGTLGFALYVGMWIALIASLAIAAISAGWLMMRLAVSAAGRNRQAGRAGAQRSSIRPGLLTLGISLLVIVITLGVLAQGILPQRMPEAMQRGWLVDRIWHLVLPVLCLSYTGLAFLSKLARSAVLENLTSDFARTARAKGLDDRTVLLRHVFRNSLLPLVTMFVAIFPALLSGSVVIERIFSINGMGRLAVDSFFMQDREVVMGIMLISGLLGLLAILVQDILYAVLDPRVSYD